MMVGGSRQETLDPGFVLLGTHQQGVPVILRKLVLPGGFDPVPKEKRKDKEHITLRNGDRHEKNELQLDRTREEGPKYSELKNASR
ncbi:unnamed protein product [Schistosoma mattheei]|uniref:Uncharacterized protein n=1 Tax=Schistosoma mattheei TaxID=31246 RepID=A0A183Q141_9TREM|nr:unnamed protein product [Schistosoma mattheei]